MSIPVEKLVDARVDQFSWFFEDEELEFIRSHKGSFFEKKEAETFSKVKKTAYNSLFLTKISTSAE